jgi:hypothetical protein
MLPSRLRSISLLLMLTAVSPLRAEGRAKIPRAADGKPDLSGVWLMQGENARYYIVPEQLPPFQPGGETRFNAKHDAADDPSGLKCLPFGVPRQIFAPYATQIVQTPGQIAILYEFEHMFRVISTAGGEHSGKPDPTWNGESIAKWDGDTLVIDTTGLNEKTWMDRGGHMHSDALHVVERYRRADEKTIEAAITIGDPKIFTKPWTVNRTYALRPGAKLGEYVCEEQFQ